MFKSNIQRDTAVICLLDRTATVKLQQKKPFDVFNIWVVGYLWTLGRKDSGELSCSHDCETLNHLKQCNLNYTIIFIYLGILLIMKHYCICSLSLVFRSYLVIILSEFSLGYLYFILFSERFVVIVTGPERSPLWLSVLLGSFTSH